MELSPDTLELCTFERDYLKSLLDQCDGIQSEAARVSGIDRSYLRRLLKKHDMLSSK